MRGASLLILSSEGPVTLWPDMVFGARRPRLGSASSRARSAGDRGFWGGKGRDQATKWELLTLDEFAGGAFTQHVFLATPLACQRSPTPIGDWRSRGSIP